jgi:hypothetical protein
MRVAILACLIMTIFANPASASGIDANRQVFAEVQRPPALLSNGGRLASFSDAVNLPLVTDDDFGRFVDPQIIGSDRRLAIWFLRLMPANKRGDFVYVQPNGRVFSNRLGVAFSVRFENRHLPRVFPSRSYRGLSQRPSVQAQRYRGDSRAFGVRPDSYPPSGGSGGAYIRTYSAQGINAAYGYAVPPCDVALQSGESGNMYFNAYNSSGGDVVDAGIGTNINQATNVQNNPGLSVSFINTGGGNYLSSGWSFQSTTYACGEPVGMMYGTLPQSEWVNGQPLSVLATGTPDYDPSQLALPPATTTWTSGAWNFFNTNSQLISGSGTWNGVPSNCTQCSIARMVTIGQPQYSNDGSCYGYCTSAGADAFWYETVAGQIIPQCSQVPQISEICTILGASSWSGGENDSGFGIAYATNSDQQASEGLNLLQPTFPDTDKSKRALVAVSAVAPASPCPPDAKGYCSSILSNTTNGECNTGGTSPHGGPIFISGYIKKYYIFNRSAPSELLSAATETARVPSSAPCTITVSWSPWNPATYYGDSSLP